MWKVNKNLIQFKGLYLFTVNVQNPTQFSNLTQLNPYTNLRQLTQYEGTQLSHAFLI
jgi:hypothetical protein